MSVTNSTNKTLQDGNGSTVAFDFTFKIFKDSDLKVYKITKETGEMGDPLVLNTDYTVTINKVGEGGTVTFTTAPTTAQQVGIYRIIDITQPANIPTDTEYVEKTLENALDRACMISQQLQEAVSRCIAIPEFADMTKEEGESIYKDVDVDLPPPVAENVLAWNEDATGLVNYDVKQDIQDFEDEVNGAIDDFKSDVNTAISDARTEFAQQITTFETEVGTEIANFENTINQTISEVSEAAEKINELEEAVQTAIDKADEATQQATTAQTAATNATTQANKAEAIATEMEENYAAITDFVTSFPPAENLTTWATLNDGQIHNIPFDDVKADTNTFIRFEDTNDRHSLRFKANTFIKLITSTNTLHFCLWNDVVINVEDYLDEGTTLTNGKDYSIFLVPDEDTGIAIKISLNKTAPVGYNAYDTRRIGGFHTECVNVGTISTNHPMNGWLAGDIIPSSVWTLWHKPAIASPSGMYYHKKLDGWRPIYVQSGTLENTVFEYGATVTRSRSGWDHEVDLGLVGLEFPTSTQFTIASLGVIPLRAVRGQAESSCTIAGGWYNQDNVRMVTEEGEESTCGGLWEILRDFAAVGGSNWSTSGANTITSPRQWGSINRLLGGGDWGCSGLCGPSSRRGDRPAAGTGMGVSARGWSRPLRARM